MERLQKVMAAAGFGSRRACEELILDGSVTVNGQVVSELPVLVDMAKDRIVVAGKPLKSERRVYFLLNKPRGVVCTHDDPSGRKRCVDLLQGVRERVFPVGRLEEETMGLLLMTNDGELTQRLTHPRFSVPKTYRAEVAGSPTDETLDKIRKGVWLSEGRTPPAKIEVIHRQRDKAILEITMREGRDRRSVRRLLAKVGHKVVRLTRITVGKLSISKVPLGAFRTLSPAEVKYLYELTEKPDSAEFPTAGDWAEQRRERRRAAKADARPGSAKKTGRGDAARAPQIPGGPPSRQAADQRPLRLRRGGGTKPATAKPPVSKPSTFKPGAPNPAPAARPRKSPPPSAPTRRIILPE